MACARRTPKARGEKRSEEMSRERVVAVSQKKFWEKLEDYMSASTFAEAGEAETARRFLRPERTVLLALTPRGADARSAEYARGVCKRVGAALEILLVPGGERQAEFLRDFKRELDEDGTPWRIKATTGCLKKKILEHTDRRSDIHFVVIESSEELDIECEDERGAVRRFFKRLKCPLVVVSEARGIA